MFSEINYKYCPHCNTKINIEDKFCNICGKELPIFKYERTNSTSLNDLNNHKNNKPRKNFSLLTQNNKNTHTNNQKTKNFTVLTNKSKKSKDNNYIQLSDIDINTATKNQLIKINGLTITEVNKIINLRDSGTKFESYNDLNKLKQDLNINYFELTNNKNIDKININTANEEILNQISYMNPYKVNTILELRESNIFIESFEDLQIKLNLKESEINNLKNKIIIQIPEPKKAEKIDINKADMINLAKIGLSEDVIAKIVLNRSKGNYISSYEELKTKYNLSDVNILKIKEVSFISQIQNQTIKENTEKIYKKSMDLNESFQQTIHKDTETNDSFEKSIQQKEDKQDSMESIEKIDINKASIEELNKLPTINLIQAKKIIELRNEGKYIKSFEDLSKKINLSTNQINQIQDKVVISEIKVVKQRVVDL
ncbi:helix-hairpin-helix domain-containing protein [Methanosphaera sp. ISO3-F5]|uniref:helix-hairpin-helix domain-containing protein n=1 Tax=Methanosphaera sp. ISO3-F5 TaxID=1452353 RepID=UPI002B25AA49|nr:helix-hairpin-helix domain-containing protein [Methanosphaera sp. ISO3-F5]WQH63664.1 helix-hairpin-helix domain-containing protein [Methanosphaera sp. ISO3-F5]